MDSIIGITIGDWITLLKQNRFRIHIAYTGKSAFVTWRSLNNSLQKRKEEDAYGEAIRKSDPVKPPVFILGHWRSGTTYLHTLLSNDSQFAYPNLFEIRNPHTFLSYQALFEKRLEIYKAQKRMMDNMHMALDSPSEEEFALAILSLKSPLLGWMFPSKQNYYDRYVTFDGVPQEDIDSWKEWYRFYLNKITYKYKKQLLLKSPLNTARIKLLLEMFPEAKFIHIHRNPFHVFQSTKKLYQTAVRASEFQKVKRKKLTQYILRQYTQIYDTFFRTYASIPNNNFIDIAFEDLESDAEKTIANIYEQLQLGDFEKMQPALRRYLDSQKRYSKNQYATLNKELEETLAQQWQPYFKAWNYSLD